MYPEEGPAKVQKKKANLKKDIVKQKTPKMTPRFGVNILDVNE